MLRYGRLVLSLGLIVAVTATLSFSAERATLAQVPGTGGYSPSFDITGSVMRPMTVDLAALERHPSRLAAHRCYFTDTMELEDRVFRGVPLWTLLTEAGPAPPPGPAPASLRGYVVVTGSDGYEVLIALAEIDPEFEGREVLVAYVADGDLLDESRGMARIIVTSDNTCMRSVWWLARIEVRYVE